MVPNAILRLALLLCGVVVAACAPAARSGGVVAPPQPADTTFRGISDTDRDIWPDPVERTEVRIEVLRRRIADHLAAERVLPASLAEILPPAGGNDPITAFGKDAWDHPLRYVPSRDDYDLRSAGPDGRFETADDIVTTRTKNTKMYWPS